MTFRVDLRNDRGDTFQMTVKADSDRHAYEITPAIANAHPEHGRFGPWTAGYTIRAS